MTASQTGEERLRQAIRRVRRPAWLEDRLTALRAQLEVLRKNQNQLEFQKAMQGFDVSMDVYNGLEYTKAEIARCEQELDVLLAGWDAQVAKAEYVHT